MGLIPERLDSNVSTYEFGRPRGRDAVGGALGPFSTPHRSGAPMDDKSNPKQKTAALVTDIDAHIVPRLKRHCGRTLNEFAVTGIWIIEGMT